MFDIQPINHLNLRQKTGSKKNDESRGTYDKDNQIRFKTSMLSLSLFDYSNVYILVKGTMTISNTATQGAAANNNDNCSLILL